MSYHPDPHAQIALPGENEPLDPPADALPRVQKRRRKERRARQKRKCSNCRKAKKGCIRSLPGETCEYCNEHGKNDCGDDLTHDQWTALQGDGKTRALSSSSAGRKSVPCDRRVSSQNRTTNRAESRSSSESADSVESGNSEVCNMFSRTPSRSDPQAWWLQKLEDLVNTKQQFQEMSGTSRSFEGADGFAPISHHFAINQILKEINEAVKKLHDHAMKASTRGHNVTAEWIFLQLFDPVRDLHDLRTSMRIKVLDDMASHYEKTKKHPQVQRISKILLGLPFERKHLEIKERAQQRMAQSILDSTPGISSALATEFPKNIGAPIGCPPLNQALLCGDREVFDIIFRKVRECTVPRLGRPLPPSGADDFGLMSQRTEGLDVPDTWGRTALFLAVDLKYEDICDELLNAGAGINFQDCYGHTLLEIAAKNGLFETAKRILSIASASGQDSIRQHINPFRWINVSTPLQAAAAAGHREIALLLLSNGASKGTQRMPDDKTAADLARDNGHIKVAEEIENWPDSNAHNLRAARF